MAIQVPFPLPSTGYALNSKVRINLDFLVDVFNEFNTGSASWDQVVIGTQNTLTGTLSFYNASNSYYIQFQPSTSSTSSQSYTWPVDEPSATPALLTSSTGGVMAWKQLKGTADQITVTDNAADVTLSYTNPAGLGGYVALFNATTGSGLLDDQVDGNDSHIFRMTVSGLTSLTGNSTVVIPAPATGSTTMITDGGAAFLGDVSVDETHTLTAYEIGLRPGTGSGRTLLNHTASNNNITWNLPADQGGANTYLKNDGSGNLTWAAAAGGADTALSNLASVAINTTLVSDTDETDDLGTSSVLWANSYIKNGYFGNSGSAGSISIYPSTASKGRILINAADNAGDTNLIIENASQAGARTYTIPDAGASTSFVMAAGTQTIGGAKTFSSDVTLAATKNIILTDDTTNTVTVALPAAVTSYTLTLPPNDGTANQVLTTDGSGVTTWETPSSGGATTALDNLASVAINTSLISDTNNTDDLGSSTKAWKDLFLTGSIKNGASTCITVSTAGEVTQPLQPCFLVTAPTNNTNQTGDGTTHTVEYDTEVYDQGANFGSYTFTAPVGGRYLLTASLLVTGVLNTHTGAGVCNLVTSNRTYVGSYLVNTYAGGGSGTLVKFMVSAVADMDASDTAYVTITISGGTKVIEVFDNASQNHFSGSLIN